MKRAGIYLILIAGFVSLPAFSMKRLGEEMTTKTSLSPLQHKTQEDLMSEREKLSQLIPSKKDQRDEFLKGIEEKIKNTLETDPDYKRLKTFMELVKASYDKEISGYTQLLESIETELKARVSGS